jgi:hypothetical protein
MNERTEMDNEEDTYPLNPRAQDEVPNENMLAKHQIYVPFYGPTPILICHEDLNDQARSCYDPVEPEGCMLEAWVENVECIAAKGIIFSIATVEWPTDDGPIITVSNPRLEADDE